MDLTWIPPLKDGGSRIMGYWVEYKEEGTEAWVKVRTLMETPEREMETSHYCWFSLHDVHSLFSG